MQKLYITLTLSLSLPYYTISINLRQASCSRVTHYSVIVHSWNKHPLQLIFCMNQPATPHLWPRNGVRWPNAWFPPFRCRSAVSPLRKFRKNYVAYVKKIPLRGLRRCRSQSHGPTHSWKVEIKRSRLELRKNFYSQRVVHHWNSLPELPGYGW